VILPVGGKGQSLVAFRQATGELAWKSGDFDAGMASPFLVEKAWTAPSLVGRRVYVRTNTALFALELP